jgi:uncharacterized protein
MATALITGASLGIGLGFAKQFAAAKNNLVLVARNEAKLNEIATQLVNEYKISVKVIAADLSDMHAVQKIYDICKAENIEINYLVNNAGVGDFGLFAERGWEQMEQMIDLNIKSLTKMCKLFLPDMLARKSGKIMNVASTAAFQPGPTMAVYFATKSYVLYLTEAIYNEIEGSGVNITCYCPGPTESGFQKAAAMEDSKLVKGKKIPTSEEVAAYGYTAMMNNKMTVIHGFMNKLIATSIRFSPRKMVLKIVRSIQDRV